jgi:hypothetical protein
VVAVSHALYDLRAASVVARNTGSMMRASTGTVILQVGGETCAQRIPDPLKSAPIQPFFTLLKVCAVRKSLKSKAIF